MVIAVFCVGLLVYDWHFILAPLHRPMTLLLLATVISFAAFYELTLRDAPGGALLTVILSVCSGVGALWLVLALFYTPLPNDNAPLLPGRGAVTSCAAPRGALHILLGQDDVLARGKGPVTPFRVGTCPAPSVTRTATGLGITGFGYDDDGSMIYQLRDNRFTLLEGEYLHLHRPDHTSLGLYDKWEREIFFVRYLAADVVRIRGHFLCGGTAMVTITDSAAQIGSHRFSQPRCLKDSGPNYAPRPVE